MSKSAPPPVKDEIARQPRKNFKGGSDPQAGLIADAWIEYFDQLAQTVDTAPTTANTVRLTTQGAAIAATDISDGTLTAGLYRFSYYARITRAASTSSSLTVTLSWTEGAVSPSFSGAAITGNTTTTVQSGSIMIRIDKNSPMTYATAYASVGATSMQYSLELTLETIPT